MCLSRMCRGLGGLVSAAAAFAAAGLSAAPGCAADTLVQTLGDALRSGRHYDVCLRGHLTVLSLRNLRGIDGSLDPPWERAAPDDSEGSMPEGALLDGAWRLTVRRSWFEIGPTGLEEETLEVRDPPPTDVEGPVRQRTWTPLDGPGIAAIERSDYGGGGADRYRAVGQRTWLSSDDVLMDLCGLLGRPLPVTSPDDDGLIPAMERGAVESPDTILGVECVRVRYTSSLGAVIRDWYAKDRGWLAWRREALITEVREPPGGLAGGQPWIVRRLTVRRVLDAAKVDGEHWIPVEADVLQYASVSPEGEDWVLVAYDRYALEQASVPPTGSCPGRARTPNTTLLYLAEGRIAYDGMDTSALENAIEQGDLRFLVGSPDDVPASGTGL